ncbi:MAG: LOG family protein [Anaerolineae bacterium]|nr:LOG family protein [Anaerolineae bacterium]
MMKVISVFGSAAPQPGTMAYKQALAVGRGLAEAGYAVATGGYVGTMEAVSRGASEAGGHVIGVTSAQIERFRPIQANRWVAEEIRYDSLRDRLMHLVLHNDGAVVLPGGIGTLGELSITWNMMQVGEIAQRPLVLLGRMWRDTVDAFVHETYVDARFVAMLTFAMTADEAVNHVVAYHNGATG